MYVCMYVCMYVHILMPGCQKKGTYREFWNCGPQNIPRLYQNSEYMYISQYLRSGMGWHSKFSPKRAVYEGRNREAGGPYIYK